MSASRRRYLVWIIIGITVLGVVAYALWPRSVDVEVVAASKQTLTASIDADGIVRAHHRFVLAMPTTGVVERIDLDPGTAVMQGQVLGYFVPPAINAQQRDEISSRMQALQAAGQELTAQLDAARILVDQTKRRADRLGRLDNAGAVAREQVENARDAYEQALRQYESIRARQKAQQFEVAALQSVIRAGVGQRLPLRSPSTGVVLRRYEQSERTVLAGTPLIEVGDTTAMEVEIDVLSTDAVKVTPGMDVYLTGWGGSDTVVAIVDRVEPAARTKVSALGIEEQRVNIIARIPRCPAALGDGYRVEAAIVTSRTPNALCIPLGALIRQGSEWFVFVDDNGIARLRQVQLGVRNAMATSVVHGLRAGERVIMHPPESLVDGDRVK